VSPRAGAKAEQYLAESGNDVAAATARIDQAERDALSYIPNPTLEEFERTVRPMQEQYELQRQYVRHLAEAGPPGSMYEVGINAHPDTFLDWDRPLSEQPEPVRQAYARAISRGDPLSAELLGNLSDPEAMRLAGLFPDSRGAQAYNTLASVEGQRPWENFSKDTMDSRASDRLREYGINGIRYLDGNSRSAQDVNDLRGTLSMWESAVNKNPADDYAWSQYEAAEAALKEAQARLSSNYVVFNDELVKILRKYGISGLGLTGGAALGGGLLGSPQDQQAQPTTF
jgi:hypothetical protein